MFIDREEELKALEERWKSKKAEFMVLYGRRRVGKTELINKLIEGKRGIRLLGRTESEKNHLDRFSADLAAFFKDDVLKSSPFQNWDAFFAYLAEKTKEEKIIIAIDEFPYFVDASASLPSILQDHWDKTLRHSRLYLILCGSSITMMLEKILGSKSPLYGRRTGQLKIEPMDFSNSRKFFRKYALKDCVYAYAILGGTPGYLMEFEDQKGILENVQEKFLRKDRFLFQDAEFLLKEELKEPKFYFSILRAIAIGKTRIGDVINETGLQKGVVSKYLSVLIDLDLVKREVPVTEKQRHKSRKGIYLLKDYFFRFWFNFIFPHIEEIEKRHTDPLLRRIAQNLDPYTSFIFEDICRDWLWNLRLFEYEKVGKWWQNEDEIDIVAINGKEKKILFAECKWQDDVDATELLARLQEKKSRVEWNASQRTEYYALFARTFKTKIRQENVFLFELKDYPARA